MRSLLSMNKKRILAASIALISLTTIASITSTLAWYTGAGYLSISNFNIKLKDEKLSISNDNETFVDFLDDSQLNQVDKFRSVSSMFASSWLENKETKPVFRGGYGTASKSVVDSVSDTSATSVGYFCQDLYIKCTDDATLTLDTELTSFKAAEEENTEIVEQLREKYPGLSDEDILFNLNNVIKSLRLSILVLNDTGSDSLDEYAYFIIDPFKDKTTYYGGVLDNDLDGYFDYYKDKQVIYGELSSSIEGKSVEDCLIYDDALTSDTSYTGDNTCFNSGMKKGTKPVNIEKSIENGLSIAEEQSIALEEAEEYVEIPVKAETSKRIVLSFYQEGWDKENTNFVMYSHFYVNVMFKIKRMGFER